MKLSVGSDHAGYPLKRQILAMLWADGHDVTDLGCHNTEPVDFPDIAKQVCAQILSGQAERGIMFCGSGAGAVIACNKIPGIRAALCHDVYTAHQCVEHDDVQVIALGGQIIGPTTAIELIRIYLGAAFSGGEEFKRRLDKLAAFEKTVRQPAP